MTRRCPICQKVVQPHDGWDFHKLGQEPVYFDQVKCVVEYLATRFHAALMDWIKCT